MEKISRINVRTLAQLALLLLTFLLTSMASYSRPASLTSEQIRRLVEQSFEVMQQHYIQPEIVPSLKALFVSKLKLGQYQDLPSVDAFAEMFGRDLRAVTGDKHLSLYTVSADEEITHILSHQEGKLTYNYGFEQVSYLHGNIGYLKFNKFSPDTAAKAVVDAAFDFLRHGSGMIIDLRDTVGGSPQLAQYMLSYFLPQPQQTPLWNVYGASGTVTEAVRVTDEVRHKSFIKDYPVWILTSSNTASAAELFAGVMQANSKAVIVGDVTAGAGFYVGVRKVTNELVFRISLAKPVIAVNQQNWEKTGIKPDIQVNSMDALDRARVLAGGAFSINK